MPPYIVINNNTVQQIQVIFNPGYLTIFPYLIWWCWIQIRSKKNFNVAFGREIFRKFEKKAVLGGFRDPPPHPHMGG